MLASVLHYCSGNLLHYRSGVDSVAYVLLDTYRKCRHLEMTQGQKLTLPLTQQHLADALGLSLVHTNKTLKSLMGRKLFRWKAGVFELLDEDRLAEAAKMEALGPQLRPLI